MLGQDDAAGATARLLDQPFVAAGRDGIVVHEAVREAIGGFLRGANPVRYREYRRAAWRELRDEVSEAAPAELLRSRRMLYLIENPVVRERSSRAAPAARSSPPSLLTLKAIAAIARRHEPPGAAAMIRTWWEEEPGTFSVVRDREGIVGGFFSLLSSNNITSSRLLDDPVVAVWARHLRENPLPKGQVALGLRRWLAPSEVSCRAHRRLRAGSTRRRLHGTSPRAAADVRGRPRHDHLAGCREARVPSGSRWVVELGGVEYSTVVSTSARGR